MEHCELRNERKRTRNIVFSRPRFNNLMSLLFCNCNGPNSTGKLASVTKAWMRKIVFLKLQTLLLSNIKGVLELLISLSSSRRTISPHNKLQAHKSSTFEVLLLCYGYISRKPQLQYDLKYNHSFEKQAPFPLYYDPNSI